MRKMQLAEQRSLFVSYCNVTICNLKHYISGLPCLIQYIISTMWLHLLGGLVVLPRDYKITKCSLCVSIYATSAL